LDQKVPGSSKTLRDHYDAVEKETGKAPEGIDDIIPVPDGVEYIFNWFRQLHQNRGVGVVVCPITWTDLMSWCQLTKTHLSPWEIAALMGIDGVFIKQQNPGE
jgi:hypothetical protein